VSCCESLSRRPSSPWSSALTTGRIRTPSRSIVSAKSFLSFCEARSAPWRTSSARSFISCSASPAMCASLASALISLESIDFKRCLAGAQAVAIHQLHERLDRRVEVEAELRDRRRRGLQRLEHVLDVLPPLRHARDLRERELGAVGRDVERVHQLIEAGRRRIVAAFVASANFSIASARVRSLRRSRRPASRSSRTGSSVSSRERPLSSETRLTDRAELARCRAPFGHVHRDAAQRALDRSAMCVASMPTPASATPSAPTTAVGLFATNWRTCRAAARCRRGPSSGPRCGRAARRTARRSAAAHQRPRARRAFSFASAIASRCAEAASCVVAISPTSVRSRSTCSEARPSRRRSTRRTATRTGRFGGVVVVRIRRDQRLERAEPRPVHLVERATDRDQMSCGARSANGSGSSGSARARGREARARRARDPREHAMLMSASASARASDRARLGSSLRPSARRT
jgi:hypothetical protein